MGNININDAVRCRVKRIEVIGKVLKIEGDSATCSFYMPRSKGMSTMKFPLKDLVKVDTREPLKLGVAK